MDKLSIIEKNIKNSVELKTSLLEDAVFMRRIEDIASKLINCYNGNGKVLFCGNGGSAADAQHLAAELSGRYYYDRPPLNAEALHVNTSYLTAVANDYSYNEIYARLVKAVGNKGDILIGLSTSGNSKNVIRAMETAGELGVFRIALTGKGGGQLAECCDLLLEIPSNDTPRIQECHMLIGHALCEIVECALFPKS